MPRAKSRCIPAKRRKIRIRILSRKAPFKEWRALYKQRRLCLKREKAKRADSAQTCGWSRGRRGSDAAQTRRSNYASLKIKWWATQLWRGRKGSQRALSETRARAQSPPREDTYERLRAPYSESASSLRSSSPRLNARMPTAQTQTRSLSLQQEQQFAEASYRGLDRNLSCFEEEDEG